MWKYRNKGNRRNQTGRGRQSTTSTVSTASLSRSAVLKISLRWQRNYRARVAAASLCNNSTIRTAKKNGNSIANWAQIQTLAIRYVEWTISCLRSLALRLRCVCTTRACHVFIGSVVSKTIALCWWKDWGKKSKNPHTVLIFVPNRVSLQGRFKVDNKQVIREIGNNERRLLTSVVWRSVLCVDSPILVVDGCYLPNRHPSNNDLQFHDIWLSFVFCLEIFQH